MAKPTVPLIWIGRTVFLGCAALVVVGSLVPFNFDAPTVTPPDLLFALTFAVVLRRPDFAPFWSLLLIFFLSDILQMRPLGLWTVIMLAACEFSRPQEYRFRELAFPFEWGFVTLIFLIALVVNRIVLSITFVPQVSWSTTMMHFAMTVLFYPAVVFVCHYGLRVRKITPDLAAKLGHRI